MSESLIVVAVDGSPASSAALGFAVSIAQQTGLGVEGVFVLDSQWPDFIGNDWQSAKGARQGFLDYIRKEQENQARLAEAQFKETVRELNGSASFKVVPGDPAEVLTALAKSPSVYTLVFGEEVFQVSGRPSLKTMAKTVLKKATRPVKLVG